MEVDFLKESYKKAVLLLLIVGVAVMLGGLERLLVG